jgi:hypothetical protein
VTNKPISLPHNEIRQPQAASRGPNRKNRIKFMLDICQKIGYGIIILFIFKDLL